MKLEVKIELLKFCSDVFNCIFLALGLSLVGCAVWILFDSGNFLNILSSDELKTVGVGLLMIGGVVMAVSIVGCLGAHSENRFLLLVYMIFIIVLTLGQLFITLLLLISSVKIAEALENVVNQIIREYPDAENGQDKLLDNVQHYAQCCGLTGPSDWLQNSFINSTQNLTSDVLPCSCFDSYHSGNSSWCSGLMNITDLSVGHGNNSYTVGCKTKLGDWLTKNGLTIIGMDISLIFVQVVQFTVAVYLYQAFSKKASLKRTSPQSDHNENLDYGEDNYAYTDSEQPAPYQDDPNYVDPNHYHN
ncbi:CD82 antigen [Sphaeramia orbicularis]|uniref:CD82 antigen n=1 Tax=Sphaeramia orbicularis TaxID=375764 RepID=UPI00117CBEC4|nr:CD82 antigen-like [Sphaeramia orbicularis]